MHSQIEKQKDFFEGFWEHIDEKKLLENIQILRPLCKGGKIFKEKEFVLKEKICNLTESKLDDEIMVQGVVDLFVVKDGKVILVDYKYSNSRNPEYLIETYKNQLKLYKIAIEKAFQIPVVEAYLLSLNSKNLIKVEIK